MKRIIIFTVLITLFINASADNPLIKNIGMSDPHIRVFNDTVYLFTGHDDHPDDKLWVMKEWRVFSTTDLVNWKQETSISTKDNYMDDNSIGCWAGDAIERDGHYFFYFSDQKRSIGVMTSKEPGGHYIDALGKPLVSPMHDPTILIDDDEDRTPYLIYGDKGGPYHIAQLNNDMISLAEEPKAIQINGDLWDKAPKWMDKNYLFKYQDTYYLSWGRDYASSKSVYGPYECVGPVGRGHHLDEFAHGSFFTYQGQFYHIWTYYIRPGFKYRECIISYCHMDDSGNIVTDTKFLDDHFSTGVGQYDASWERIEAEWYYEKSEEIKKQNSADGGFELTNIENGSWIRFANVNFGEATNTFSALVSDISGQGNIEIRLDTLSGPLVGKVFLPKIYEENTQMTVSCDLENIVGKHDVYLRFKGQGRSLLNIDCFQFESLDRKVSIYH